MQNKVAALSLALPILCLALPGSKQEKPPKTEPLAAVKSRTIVSQTLIFQITRDVQWGYVLSPDNSRVAYKIHRGKEAVVVDGKEQKTYIEIVDLPIFSPDSKHVAYGARDGPLTGRELSRNPCFMVIDGKEGKRYDSILFPAFSPDSQRLAYSAMEGGKGFIVVNGKEGKRYRGVLNPIFSPDSQRIVYKARAARDWFGGEQFVVVDGKEGKKYDDIVGFPVFSPNSKRVAYGASERGEQFVVLDGKEGKRYAAVGGISFSPDSKRVAYNARIGRSRYRGKQFVVVDGKGQQKYAFFDPSGDEPETPPLFSPDSKRVAYQAATSSMVHMKQFVVIDGKEGKKYGGVWPNSLVFSPDSKRLAYVVSFFVVVDGREDPKYHHVYERSLVFSPDSNCLAYAARAREGGSRFVVVNGTKGKQYDDIVTDTGSGIVFDSSDTLHYVAQKGNRIYLVEETIE